MFYSNVRGFAALFAEKLYFSVACRPTNRGCAADLGFYPDSGIAALE
jgi:hypothetical protein